MSSRKQNKYFMMMHFCKHIVTWKMLKSRRTFNHVVVMNIIRVGAYMPEKMVGPILVEVVSYGQSYKSEQQNDGTTEMLEKYPKSSKME